MTGDLFGGIKFSKRSKEQEPKSVEDFDNTSQNSARTSPSWVMTAGAQPGPCKSNTISRLCGGKRFHVCSDLERGRRAIVRAEKVKGSDM